MGIKLSSMFLMNIEINLKFFLLSLKIVLEYNMYILFTHNWGLDSP